MMQWSDIYIKTLPNHGAKFPSSTQLVFYPSSACSQHVSWIPFCNNSSTLSAKMFVYLFRGFWEPLDVWTDRWLTKQNPPQSHENPHLLRYIAIASLRFVLSNNLTASVVTYVSLLCVWYLARLFVKNRKDWCYIEIGPCAQCTYTILGSIVSTLGKVYLVTFWEN